jgi:hypothetical protein
MIDINSIIHISNQAFEIDKHIAVLCLQDYKKQAGAFEFKKDNIYSIEFAKSVGTVINHFTLTCTKQKDAFKIIANAEIKTPIITLQQIQELEIEPQEEIQETQYRFETSGYKQKDGSAFRKNSIYTETEIKEAGLDIQELFDKEAITWLK